VVKEPDRGRIYNVISTFKDGDHRVGNLFPDSGLVTELISMMYYQSTAEIILLPVSKNAGPPHWNSTSGFDFDLFVIDMSFCIRRLAAELTSYPFFKMAADSHIGFDLGNVRHPRSAIVGLNWSSNRS